MIGGDITKDKDGDPIAGGKKLSQSAYHPSDEVLKLFNRVQLDYQRAWALQHRTFDEFDGHSLLQRTKMDQETFGAFVGAQYVPQQKKWRWKGRKNTSRNKLIGILAHMLSGMLFPLVNAQNKENESDKTTAKVMRILVEDHLRKTDYQTKFLYIVLSALVNPAVLVEIDYVVAFQKIKEQLKNGEVKITEAIDTFLTGLALNIVPIDQLLLGDFYTGNIQHQPYLIRVNRISWDQARKIYSGRFFVEGKDQFEYVEAGKTRVFLAGQEHQTLFDIDWTEADRNAVQVLTAYYRDEDLEVTFVGGVFMGNYTNPYNTNPFSHRRMSLVNDEWKSIPIYPFAKSGFEPIDPTGRFAYFKSGAFKEYWDDATQNKMHQLLVDGTFLDVIKPMFIGGLTKVDSTVIAPGATVGVPLGSTVTPFQMGPNLVGAMKAMDLQKQDMSESTQDKIMNGVADPNVTATATIQAQNQARIFLGVFGVMMADLITQIGYLTMDCIIQHTTQGEIDATIPESLNMKYKTILAKGKEKGKEVTNQIVFTDAFMGKEMTQQQKDEYEWKLWKKQGSDNVIYEVNPYRFARTVYSFYIDPADITDTAMGNNKQKDLIAFNMFANPIVSPFVDMKEVVDEFVIEKYGGSNPDRFKIKGNVNAMMGAVMGQGGQPGEGIPAEQGRASQPKVDMSHLNQLM